MTNLVLAVLFKKSILMSLFQKKRKKNQTLYLDRYKYLACKCHSIEFVWRETLRNNRKWGFFCFAEKQKKIPDGGLSVCRETWEATFHSFAKGTMWLRAHRAARMGGESSKWDERWRKVQEKKESTSQILRFKQICVVPDARVFLAGCTGTPFL